RDVLLPVGDEVAIGTLGIDGHVNTEAQPGRLGGVLHQLNLGAVITDAINVESLGGRLNARRDSVDQGGLAALGAGYPFETHGRISAWKGAEVMRDRIVIAVIPV